MFSFTVFLLSSVVLCTAQGNTGPQTFIDQGQDNGKQFVTRDFTYIIAPLQFNSQREDSAKVSNQDNQEKSVEEAQSQIREESRSESIGNQDQDSFYRKVQELISSGKLINAVREQNPLEQQIPNVEQKNRLQKQFLNVVPENYKVQDGKRFSEEFQKQWSRILGYNQDLKSLSEFSEGQFVNAAQPEADNESNKEEQRSGGIGNGIQYILRNHGINGLEKQNDFGSQESNYQNRPFVFQQQRKPIEENEALLKALSAVAGEESSNVAEPNNKEQENDDVRKVIDDILKSRNYFGKQNRFESRPSNYGPYDFIKNNLKKVRAQKQSNNGKEQERNIEIRKLIEDALRKRENDENEQNVFKSEVNVPSLNEQDLERISNNNRVHLKALSSISEDELLKEFSAFNKRP